MKKILIIVALLALVIFSGCSARTVELVYDKNESCYKHSFGLEYQREFGTSENSCLTEQYVEELRDRGARIVSG